MPDKEIEQEIQERRLNAPRITPDAIEQAIASEQYHVFEKTTFTVRLLTLTNGYRVFGYSACVSPEDFDTEIGREYARENAKQKIWALEGYRLKEVLYQKSINQPSL